MNASYTLGLVSVSFRRHTPREILEAVRAAGLACIEWGSDVHAPCANETALRRIAAMQAEYGIVCSSYGTYFRLGQTPLSELETYVSAAKILGTDTLRLWCGSKSGAAMTEDERGALVEECRKTAEIAERCGVTLCMECHTDTFTERLEDALFLMDTINSPHFQMYWQPSQWRCRHDNVAYAEALSAYVKTVHVFQWKETQRFPLRRGHDEWCTYLSCLPHVRTLLLEFMPNDTLEELAVEAAALKAMVGGDE